MRFDHRDESESGNILIVILVILAIIASIIWMSIRIPFDAGP